MKFRITHLTVFNYKHSVGLCQNEARLQPRNFWRQQCTSSQIETTPEFTDYQERDDFFGNPVAYFAIHQPHFQLQVTATSHVNILKSSAAGNPTNPVTWQQVQKQLQETIRPPQYQTQSQSQTQQQNQDSLTELQEARPYVLDSPMITATAGLADYAKDSFLPERPLIETVMDLTQRIFSDFTYDPSFTTIATPLHEVLQHRRGVCQDFAHLAIGCLRSYGLAARYISGYIETLPAPGMPRLVGADASHAWFAVYVPGTGWLEFDPTNNSLPNDQHITLGWGRDYSDVTPLKGIAYGGGEHELSVSVDVLRLE